MVITHDFTCCCGVVVVYFDWNGFVNSVANLYFRYFKVCVLLFCLVGWFSFGLMMFRVVLFVGYLLLFDLRLMLAMLF